MKKFLVLALVLCCLTSCGVAFKFQPASSYEETLTTKLASIEGLYSSDKNGVYIQHVIEVNGSKDELYVKLLEFLTRTYNDANAVIQVKEKDQGLIVCKGCHKFHVNDFLYGSAIEETAWHVYKAEIKENKIRVTITLNEMDWYRPASYAAGVSISSAKGTYSILECPPYKNWDDKDVHVRKGYVFYYAVGNIVNLMDATKNALKNAPSYDIDDNW